jgi:hypothetical protein
VEAHCIGHHQRIAGHCKSPRRWQFHRCQFARADPRGAARRKPVNCLGVGKASLALPREALGREAV